MAGQEIILNRQKPGPWGFRLQGGVDFEKALTVIFVNEGSFSYNSGLRTGDVILKIGDLEGALLTHKEAQEAIIEQGNSVRITIKRQNDTVPQTPANAWKPDVQLVGGPATQHDEMPRNYTKTSLAIQPPPQEEHFDVKHNITAKGFQAGAPPPQVKSVSAPVTRSDGQPVTQQQASNEGVGTNGFRSVAAPQASGRTGQAPSAPICWVCSKQISGVFLQAKGEPLCVECFKCAKCGAALRNVGHFVIGGKLYCQAHAREAQNILQGKGTDEQDTSTGGMAATSGSGGSAPTMPQSLAANLAKLTMRPQGGQKPVNMGATAAVPQTPMPSMGAPPPQLSAPAQNKEKNEWSDRLNANSAGMASNAEDFTKEFMKQLMG
eukprot:TRINITY_DN12158_c0_g1_i1.p1 TRINITY_DN12158_c0_g1~~TRINITY_DN12158_c0_g1_i1.p1  ORF type:complete len:378 (+),score=84.24 TRINITY_DN12158_c0_g1_i1:49-1182(+)